MYMLYIYIYVIYIYIYVIYIYIYQILYIYIPIYSQTFVVNEQSFLKQEIYHERNVKF